MERASHNLVRADDRTPRIQGSLFAQTLGGKWKRGLVFPISRMVSVQECGLLYFVPVTHSCKQRKVDNA